MAEQPNDWAPVQQAKPADDWQPVEAVRQPVQQGDWKTVSTDTGTYGEQFRAGVQGTKSSFGSGLEALGKQLGVTGLVSYGQRWREEGDKDLANLPDLPPVEEILAKPDLGNVFDYVTKGLVRASPQIIGTTGLAATALVTLPESAALATATGIAALTGGLLGTGDTYAELRRHGADRPDAALASGAAQGLLEAMPVMSLVSRGRKLLGFHPEKSLIKTLAVEGAKSAGQEALTEGLQEATTLGTRALVADTPTQAETVSRILNAAVQGGLAGGVFGGATATTAQRFGRAGYVEPFHDGKPDIAEVPTDTGKWPNAPLEPQPIPEEMAVPKPEYQRGDSVEKGRQGLEKKSNAGLAVRAVDILEVTDPETLRRTMMGEDTLNVQNLDRLAGVLDTMQVRGLSEQQQINLLSKRYAERTGVEIEEAKAHIGEYKQVFDALRKGTEPARGDVVVTYNGPERPAMERLARQTVPDAKVFVTPAAISVPVTQYADGKYVIAARDFATFEKSLAGIAAEEAFRRLPDESKERIQQKFRDSAEGQGSLMGQTWGAWLMQNVETDADLAPIANALADYTVKTRGLNRTLEEQTALRRENQQWIAQNAQFPIQSKPIRDLVNRLRKQAEPKEQIGNEEISTLDPALDAAVLTAQDVVLLEKTLKIINKMPFDKKQLESMATDNLQGIGFIRNWTTLLQQQKLWPQLQPVQTYVNAVQDWSAFANRWHERTKIRSDEMARLGPDQNSRVRLALTEATLTSESAQRPLSNRELEELFDKHGVNAYGKESAVKELGDYKDYNNALEQETIEQVMRSTSLETLVQDLKRMPSSEEIQAAAQKQQEILQEVKKDFDRLRDRTYVPLSRFGKHVVNAIPKRDLIIDGKTYRKGSTYYFETFSSRREQQQHADYMQSVLGEDFAVGMDELSDNVRALIGMPAASVNRIITDLNLSPQDASKLEQYAYKYAPGRSHLKHMIKRKGLRGFSNDRLRVYADYMFNAANNIARVKYVDTLTEQINALSDRAETRTAMRQAGLDASGLARVHNLLSKHFSDIMSPGKSYSYLNHAAFVYYFAMNLAQPIINLTQTGLVTFPYMSNMEVTDAAGVKHKFGHQKAMLALGNAFTRMRNYWRNPEGMNEADQMILKQLTDAGILDQSFAAEVASLGAADTLQRVGSASKAEQVSASVISAMTWPFKSTELLNRWMTAVATLELTKGLDQETRFKAVRDVIQSTHFELSRWNRPSLVRGGLPAVLYVMKSFTQGMLFHIAKQPGGRETLMMIFLLTGMMGLPFAEDVLDVSDLVLAVAKKTGLLKGRPSSREKIQEFLHEKIPDWESVALHGLGRMSVPMQTLSQLFGAPVPSLDGIAMEKQLQMGHIIPAVSEVSQILQGVVGESSGRDPNSLLVGGATDIGGAALGIVHGFYKAMTSKDPSTSRTIINTLPAGFRRAARAWQAARAGEYTDSKGNRLAKVDVSDPEQMAEIAAYGLGFTPTRIAAATDLSWAQREAASYWMAQKDMIMSSMTLALANKDQNEVAAARRAMRRYNNEAPPGMGISGSDLSGLKPRLKGDSIRDLGLPSAQRQIPLYREQAEARSMPLLRGAQTEKEVLPRPTR